MANAQTRKNGNPHNEQVFTFIRYVQRLRPAIFVRENVAVSFHPGVNRALVEIKLPTERLRCLLHLHTF
jgi:site-specific DNA-cytosine methylase